jgi:CheY-like chemotaxis protein
MLVEDDPAVARAVSRALSGCDVVSFSSGTDALESLRRGSSFDVALCDLMMPQMSGMELYAALEEEWPSLAEQTLFLTGGAFTDETSDFLQRIGRRAVHKPFTVRGLRDVVADRLARRPTAG